eukprot:m.24164 g.24164  ORF g.24164 m.24164 type:complete len:129 (-) comp9629_c0_seq1:274-660(-)
MARGGRRAITADESVQTTDDVPFRSPFKSKLKGKSKAIKNLKGALHAERQEKYSRDAVLYSSISAPVPLLPVKKYCDLTGLLAKYRDPKTHLLYHSKAEFVRVHELPRSGITALLTMRGANAQHVAMM